MQRAPWTKVSTSTGQARQISATSAPDSSRATTTRVHPAWAASRAPPEVKRLIWVLAWRGWSGSAARRAAKSPQSWTKMASVPARQARRAVSRAAGSSRSVTKVLRVR